MLCINNHHILPFYMVAMKTIPRLPLTIILDNVRSAYNVGSIFRTADCAWIEQVITCGYTPSAAHPKVKKTALGSEEIMRTIHYPDLNTCLTALQQQSDLHIYAMEVSDDAQSVWELEPIQLAQRTALIFGNEVEGVQLDVTRAHGIPELKLPQFGVKQSLNVGTAASIAIYHWRYIVTNAGLLG